MARYNNIKEYIYGEYGENIKDAISLKFFSEGNKQESISEISVMSFKFTDDVSSTIKMEIGVSAVILNKSNTEKKNTDFFIITLKGNIDLMFKDIVILDIQRTESSDFPEDNIFSLFFLPDIQVNDLDDIGNEIYGFYKKNAKMSGYGLSTEHIIRNMNAMIFFADLPDGCLGRVYLSEANANILCHDNNDDQLKYAYYHVEPGTVVINIKRYYDKLSEDGRITVAHELVHLQYHQRFFKILSLLGIDSDAMDCRTQPISFDENMTDIEQAICIAEWQANALSMRIAISEMTVGAAIEESFNDIDEIYYENLGNKIQDFVIMFARKYNVSCYVAKERLRQFGIDCVDGTMLEYKDNGKMVKPAPFYFEPGTLKENETFVIYRADYEKLLREDKNFAELMNFQICVYTGYVVCLYDAKYIKPVRSGEKMRFILSDYAREHADECCLRFEYCKKQHLIRKYDFSINEYLCNLINAPYSEDNGDGLKLTSDALKDKASFLYRKKEDAEAQKELLEMKIANVISFSDALKYHINKKGIKAKDICDEIYLKENTLDSYLLNSNRRKSRNPSLNKVMIICNKLNLKYKVAIDLLKRAGICLNTDEAKDALYDYLLTITNATLEEWDLYLKEAKFPPLQKT